MDEGSQEERQLRAVRDQAVFRAVNEKLRSFNEPLASRTDCAVAGEFEQDLVVEKDVWGAEVAAILGRDGTGRRGRRVRSRGIYDL